jgi:hypothetical protein
MSASTCPGGSCNTFPYFHLLHKLRKRTIGSDHQQQQARDQNQLKRSSRNRPHHLSHKLKMISSLDRSAVALQSLATGTPRSGGGIECEHEIKEVGTGHWKQYGRALSPVASEIVWRPAVLLRIAQIVIEAIDRIARCEKNYISQMHCHD